MEIVVRKSTNLVKFKDLQVGDFFFNTDDINNIDTEILAMVIEETENANAVCIDAQSCLTFCDGELLYFNNDATVIRARPIKFICEY